MLWLTACGSETPDPKNPDPKTVEVPATPSSELALPVTAPMAVRRRLLDDLKTRNEAARQRGADLDAVIERNR
jgi:hypothetical protein